MADLASELRHAMEALIGQRVDGMAAQRGWDEGAAAAMALSSPDGIADSSSVAVTFATGYDSGTGLTTTPFTFGISVFGGGDLLL